MAAETSGDGVIEAARQSAPIADTAGLDLVWYVSYGSNLSRERFQRYLDAAPPDGPPAADQAITIDHRLFFAHESRRWTGGSAFVDPAAPGVEPTLARAWLITRRQFDSVVAQENGRSQLSLGPEVANMAVGSCLPVDSRRYGLVIAVASPDARPARTFTTPESPLPAATVPADVYVHTIVTGLMESHRLGRDDALGYVRRHVEGA